MLSMLLSINYTAITGILVLFVALFLWLIFAKIKYNNMLKAKDPNKLEEFQKIFLDLIKYTELSTIFIKISNDGETIIFQEKTVTRKVLLKLSYNKFWIEHFDLNNNLIKIIQDESHIIPAWDDEEWLKYLRELYLQTFDLKS